MSVARQAASVLASKHGTRPENVQGTDLWGVRVQDGTPITDQIRAEAEGIAKQVGSIAAVTLPWSGGFRFIGFSQDPEGQRAALANMGKVLDRLDLVKTYGDRPLYDGAWTCVGNDCLTPWGTRK